MSATPAAVTGVDQWEIDRFARREQPVFWHDRRGGEPFWAVTTYAEPRAVLNPGAFRSATARGVFLRGSQTTEATLPDGAGGPMIDCLGAHQARLMLRVELEELLARLPSIELAGVPEGLRSNLVSGQKHLPIRVSG